MFNTIAAKDVTEGMKFTINYAPGRDASPVVREVIDNEDGTFSFTLATYGLVGPYKGDRMVSVRV